MNTNPFSSPVTSHENIMESLVYEEIDRQLMSYLPRMRKYINRVEVATFALNRLPALYASSQEGKVQQYRQGQKKYRKDIVAAVRRGLAAVEQDPFRSSTPLINEAQHNQEMAENALHELQQFLISKGLLRHQNLSWKNLTKIINQVLSQVLWSKTQDQADYPQPTVIANSTNYQ
jgi:restriction endonuclease Mrr